MFSFGIFLNKDYTNRVVVLVESYYVAIKLVVYIPSCGQVL
jgi:hypothetical protein